MKTSFLQMEMKTFGIPYHYSKFVSIDKKIRLFHEVFQMEQLIVPSLFQWTERNCIMCRLFFDKPVPTSFSGLARVLLE